LGLYRAAQLLHPFLYAQNKYTLKTVSADKGYRFFSKPQKFNISTKISELSGTIYGVHRNFLANGTAILKEPEIPYNALFDAKKALLSYKNTYIWNKNV
jgi:hypothetical protein